MRLVSAVALFTSFAGLAEQRMLEYVLPRGGSIGSTVDVTLHGQHLEDPQEIAFSNDCIHAVNLSPGDKPATDVKAHFVIGRQCPPGEHVLWLRTATSLSEPVTFWVSPFLTIHETEVKPGANDTPALAQSIPLNSTVEGQILPGADMDVDVYKVDVPTAGQRLSVEIEAVRLGTTPQGGENDLMLRILDARGAVLAESKDSALFVQDPVASITVPSAGAYFIEIKQHIFTPPRLAFYRAHIGTFSRPLVVFPAGGRTGEQLRVRILGDPQGEREETVPLPSQPGNFAYFTPAGKPPSANTLRVSPYPNVIAVNTSGPTPVPDLPAALNGILTSPEATFRFTARKSEQWKIQVFARTLGSPMDPKIWIRLASQADKNILEADDATLTDLGHPGARNTWTIKDSLDPCFIFKPPADADYILGIEDSRGLSGPRFVYRIEIEPVHDSAITHISMNDGYLIPRLTGLIIPRGNRWTLDVQIAPGLGSQPLPELVLEASGLPRGVQMIAPHIPQGQTRVPVQFVAAPDAEPRIAFIELNARPAGGKPRLESRSHQSFGLINRGNERPLHVVFLDRYALAVTQPAPFRVELQAPAAPLVQSGELALKVKLTRTEGFSGAVEIIPDWLPPNVSKGGVVTIAAAKSEGEFTIRAAGNAAPGTYQIAMNASTNSTGDGFSGVGRIRVSSAFVPLTIAEPYMKITLRRSAIEQGRTGEIRATIDPAKSFTGEAKLTLKNLPKGVTLLDPVPKVTAQTHEAVFSIQADSGALAGLYKEIACDIAITTAAGQTLHQQAGSGLLRVDPARSSVAVTQ